MFVNHQLLFTPNPVMLLLLFVEFTDSMPLSSTIPQRRFIYRFGTLYDKEDKSTLSPTVWKQQKSISVPFDVFDYHGVGKSKHESSSTTSNSKISIYNGKSNGDPQKKEFQKFDVDTNAFFQIFHEDEGNKLLEVTTKATANEIYFTPDVTSFENYTEDYGYVDNRYSGGQAAQHAFITLLGG